jgi:regulator of ribonuclease activity A
MEYKTTGLCDAFLENVSIADATGFKDYGGRKTFGGKIHTIQCFEGHAGVEKIPATDGTGKVLVVDGGGLSALRLAGIAVKNNWGGIIINGCIRDSATTAGLNVGLKALSTYPISKVTDTEWPENIEVNFAGITFTPGHFVYCDDDGIITSAKALAL